MPIAELPIDHFIPLGQVPSPLIAIPLRVYLAASICPPVDAAALADAFAAFFSDPVEIGGAVLSALSIWLLARQRVLGWPIGIVATALYIPVYYRAALFADMALYALVYLPGQLYGWYVWTRGSVADVLPVSRISWNWLAGLLLGAALAMAAIGLFLDRSVGQPLAYWDAFTTAFAVAGQVMQARKWIENWLLWIVVDSVAAGVYFVKGLYPTMVLYGLFLVLAAQGYAAWKRDLRAAPQTVDA